MLMGVLNPTSGKHSESWETTSGNSRCRSNSRWDMFPSPIIWIVGCVSARSSVSADRPLTNWNDDTCRDMLDLFELGPTQERSNSSQKGCSANCRWCLAVSHEPQLLLLDEPMAGLDPLAREEFLDGVLRTVCERGQTVLFSSHSLDDVQRVADSIGFMYRGRFAAAKRHR